MNLSFALGFEIHTVEKELLEGARITYVDQAGHIYQSIEVGELRVYDIDDFMDNEFGLPTLQYSIDFSTFLMNKDDPFDIVEIRNATARLASLKR